MNKKRLIVYAAIILAFALACTAHILPNVRVFAYSYDAAEIGTATLADAGDTVFIRTAVFTAGEDEIIATGFTVGSAAAGEDPAADVDLSVLTPITKENPLTGTLDKDICFCDGAGAAADVYLGTLKLAEGRRIYTKGGDINLLGGSLETPAIQTAGTILIGSADVTVNGDLTGFLGVNVYASEEDFGAGANKPGTLTVKGDLTNGERFDGEYAVSVNSGSTLNVTGNISTVYGVDLWSPGGDVGKSQLTVGGDVVVTGDGIKSVSLMNASAEIGGGISAAKWVHVYKNSYLAAESVRAYLLAATSDSTFDIAGDVTVENMLDLNCASGALTNSVGGNLKCGIFSAAGKSTDAPMTVSVAGDVECDGFFSLNCVLDFNGALKQNSSPFRFEYTTADIAGSVTGNWFEPYYSDVQIRGDLKSGGGTAPVIHSKLTVDGSVNAHMFNPLYSDVTVKGDLTTHGYLTLNYGSVLRVEKNMNNNGTLCLVQASQLEVGGDITTAQTQVLQSSKLTSEGNYTCSGDFSVHGSQTVIGKDMNVSRIYDVNYNGSLTVKGNAKGGPVSVKQSTMAVEGDLDARGDVPIIHGSTLTVGGDAYLNRSSLDVLNGSTCEIGGDVKDAAYFGVVFGTAAKPGKLTVGGDVDCIGRFVSCRYSRIEVGGSVACNTNAGLIEGEFIVGGDFTDPALPGTYRDYNGIRVKDTGLMEIGGDVRMHELILNYDDYENSMHLGGVVDALRIANVVRSVDGDYVIEGVAFDPADTAEYEYKVPFDRQLIDLTVGGASYALDIRNRSQKSFEPVPVGEKYNVRFELGGGAFKDYAAIEEGYYAETGLDLPIAAALASFPGFLFDGWYDNAACEGDPVTSIPAGSAGDVVIYAKWNVCDHPDAVPPTCTEDGVCPLCTMVLPATGHSYLAPVWNWTDEANVTVTFTCALGDYEETFVIPADAITSEVTVPEGLRTSGVRRFTAAFTIDGETYTSDYDTVIPPYGKPCVYCGEIHDRDFMGWLTGYIHAIRAVFENFSNSFKRTFG